MDPKDSQFNFVMLSQETGYIGVWSTQTSLVGVGGGRVGLSYVAIHPFVLFTSYAHIQHLLNKGLGMKIA